MTTGRSRLDPFGLIAEIGARIEKAGNRAGNERMRSAEFSETLNRALAVSLGVKKLSGDALRRVQFVFNVASHDDIVALQEKLAAIDEKLLAMTQVLARLDPQPPAAEAARPRTRKPPPEPAPAPAAAEPPPPAPKKTPRRAHRAKTP